MKCDEFWLRIRLVCSAATGPAGRFGAAAFSLDARYQEGNAGPE